ncbi:flagellar biosynthetic protein FliR [Pseudogulbenkiania subflava]|uniref:Flagellar biosynthetic protein FliR n=1 Tax=Pseudogulbenkiania subflava DSM 22618 TaxID=1123014 RepID=A0A1Y6BTX9_9NEIS|nr:flagellar biosynthetic protein FliR [Pseudogulbenkiania subflava]SMF25070.1 flagellar biosynthetic protein FliR [Pseudogulbenkiania subflava DSM 22618]
MFPISDLQINALVSLFVWPFARIMGVLLADPLFSSRSAPARFKAGFALLLTLLLVPLLPPQPAIPVVSAEGVAVLVQQLLIGLALGLVMRVVITAVEMAGFVMGTQMGLGFASFYDPINSAQVPTIARILTLFTFLLFLLMGGHQVVIETLLDSFRTLPIGMTLPPDRLKALAEWGGHIFNWGLWLALPVVAALLVTNLAIGVMTRASPQFNIFTFGFPLTLLVGFAALYLSVPLMAPAIESIYREAFAFMQGMLKSG